MKDPTSNPRQIVDQFLGRMAEPVSEEQNETATSAVLERLRMEDVQVLSFPGAVLPQLQPVRSNVWSAIAAAAVAMLAGGLLHLVLQRPSGVEVVAKPVSGEIQIVGTRTTFPGHSGIQAGKVLRAGNAGGVIELLDGSRIDLSADSELSIDREGKSFRVRLALGTVLVTAAKQREGHLYVETKDCVVSVTGTVFAVSTEESGSRVSVLEGEVQIRRGEISRTLLAGQQATTSPELGPLSGEPAIVRALERVAVVQQPPAQQAPQAPQAATGSIIRGIVKGTNGAGIPDVSVTLCPNFTEVKANFTEFKAEPSPQDPSRRAPFDDTVHVAGPIVRNKTFFFGIWDCVRSTVVTDSMGNFEFSNVEPGEYAVRAQREGFLAPAADVSSANGAGNGTFRYFDGWNAQPAISYSQLMADSMRVTVYAQQVSQDISLSLVRAGVIAGSVRDADGKPVVNARVRIVSPRVTGAMREGPTLMTTATNDRGAYRAFWLAPGEYRVVAEAPRSGTYWVTRAATAPEGNLIVLREGEEVSNIDVVLRPGVDDPAFPNPRP
jgi:hypothetical protein